MNNQPTYVKQLRRDLPGLRGYSPSSMKNMRKFYESWIMLDANSSVATDELENSTFANVDLINSCTIDIYHAIKISDVKDFPMEDFSRLPFSHHIKIIEGCKELMEDKD